MSKGFEKRRVLFFRDDGSPLPGLIAAHGGVPLAVAAAPGAGGERPKTAVQEIFAGAVDFLLFARPAEIDLLMEAAGGRRAELLEPLARIGIATLDPETTAAVDAAGLRSDYEADPSVPASWVGELARRGLDLLAKKRRSHDHGVDTNRWRRIDARWEKEPAGAAAADSVFLRACRRQPVPHTPIWIMRQAGRYQREYRAVRRNLPFLELCRSPEIAAEVTLMAIDRLGVDAAIIFSDILMVLEPLGITVRFAAGDGPVVDNPVRTGADLERLPAPDGGPLEPVYEAIRLTRRALRPDIALIGFCGAPFTVATYIVEGGKSRHFARTKGLMYGDRKSWDRLMERLTTISAEYLNRQIAAGADAVQLFDSWVGILSPSDYRQFVLPHMQRLIAAVRKPAPVIHFATGNPALLPLQKEAGGDVFGLDWRIDLDAAWQQLGDDVAVMGNLDPVVLLSPPDEIRRRARRLLESAGGRPGHIFNLGHGVLPGTPPDHVAALIDEVQEHSR